MLAIDFLQLRPEGDRLSSRFCGEALGGRETRGTSFSQDGGVRSQLRTGLDPELPDKWLFTGYFRELLPVIAKCIGIRCVDSITCKTIP